MMRKLVNKGPELQRSGERDEYEQAHIFSLYICHITCLHDEKIMPLFKIC